jgi:DNA-binding CsgD family transcriptional regulator
MILDAKLSNVIALIYHYSQGKSECEFKEACFTIINTVLEFESAAWVIPLAFDERPHFYLYKLEVKFEKKYIDIKKHIEKNGELNNGIAVYPCSLEEQRQFYLNDLYNQLQPYNIEHILSSRPLDEYITASHGISLYRDTPHHLYSSHDVEVFNVLVPHLLQSYKLNKTYTLNYERAGIYIYRVVCNQCFDILESDDSVEPLLKFILKEQWQSCKFPIEKLDKIQSIELKVEMYKDLYFIELYCPSNEYKSLTLKEKEIVELLSKNYSNNEIAAQLYISPKTLNNHLSKIYYKFETTSKNGVISKLSKYPTLN